MRNIIILAAIMAILGTFMAREADRMTSQQAQTKAKPAEKSKSLNAFASMQPPERAQATEGRSVTIPRDRRGHFQTEGSVDGRRIDFMVDTGASAIALNESSAARVGVYPRPDDYTAHVSTANGTVKAARTRLRRVSTGGPEARCGWAWGLRATPLARDPLGLSFLSKLKRYEFAGGKLVMEQ